MANLTLRPSIESLELAPDQLQALRDSYGKMQALRGDDNRSWVHQAGLHGFPQWMCWHHGRIGQGDPLPYNLFLPWHRAYLLYWENFMKDQNGQAVLPWWDWTSDTSHKIGVPASFSQPQANGQPSPLFSGPVPALLSDPPRQTTRFPGLPAQLPTPDRVENLLALTSFVDFTAQLEDIHDFIHGWTGGMDPNNPDQGGDMGNVGTAAYDPIFWSHHCMIDRIWYLWQLRQGVNNIPDDYTDKALAPFGQVVNDVLDINRLGYEYVASQQVLTTAGPA